MADVVASLAIKLEALGAEQAKRELAGVETEAAKAKRSTEGLSSSLGALKTAVVGLVGVGLVREMQQLADTATRVRGQLALVSEGTGTLAVNLKVVRDIAITSRAPLEATASLYTRIAQASEDLGLSSSQVAAITQTVARSLAVSGTNATQAAGSLLQLGQALGGGIVRAEEFNSILEGNRGLLAAVARAGNTSVAQLRNRVIDGGLSSQEFAALLLKASTDIEQSFQKMDATVGSSAESIKTAFVSMVGEADKATGASRGVASAFQGIAGFLASDGAFVLGAGGFALALGGIAAALYAIVPAAVAAGTALTAAIVANPATATLVAGLAGAGVVASLIAGQSASAAAREQAAESAQQATVDGIVQKVRARNAKAPPPPPRGGAGTTRTPTRIRTAGPMQSIAQGRADQQRLQGEATRQFVNTPISADGVSASSSALSGFSAAELLPEWVGQMREVEGILQQGIASSVSNGIAGGFAAAVQSGSITEGFKALGRTFLAGLGGMLQQIGTQALLANKLIQRLMERFTGPLGAASAVALIAFGGVLQGLAGRTSSQGSVPVGASPAAIGSSTGTVIDRGLIGLPSFAGAGVGGGLALPGNIVVLNNTFLSPNDPTWQRQLSESIRGIKTREG